MRCDPGVFLERRKVVILIETRLTIGLEFAMFKV
jgi:hypothetical protein